MLIILIFDSYYFDFEYLFKVKLVQFHLQM